ncbi:hypothetical protein ABB37_01346 [Leptomonas pyrrhocoris]|uniref:Uncharacterized protein n=1 Tax=Leptomonas pyrrhocoris TaxID=157538 RepID=A0A0N0DZ52_LEPPY|nr:hypothetical protein ABB37_01346 [Leptomonas pyrrhocoris]KPA84892.1 hypothetical protein ABB37_01346 [Leptomonas pyrrhocoris]|eukprot:XP_015663331.1 hypothetical protein ABB37_01346 [Leptomonas pyrrhocoris]
MSAAEHSNAAPPPASASAAPRTALPWQPREVAVAPTPTSSSADDIWDATVSSIPYLSQTHFSGFSIVYKPPTVIQLSEATGCSVSELAGAYNDLPFIQLCKELPSDAAATVVAADAQTFDSFDYLQLVPIDETLELATNAVRARRPVPDAEETFWEADYWEKLKRIKQEEQQRKDMRRRNKMAKEGKREANGASVSTVVLPYAYTLGNTLSATNSPSFMTPHSRQGSLSGHVGDAETSPTMASLQSAQRQKRIAKGLLRRARYNESHNPSHAQLHTTRSASLASQNSIGGSLPQQQQPVIRCRTRPRSYSINSQQTDVRGFQYSLSSAMSEGGRSALSDSLRTPPPLSINVVPQPREAFMTSIDLELSTSGDVTKSGATTHSRSSAARGGRKAAALAVSPPQVESVLSPHSSRVGARGSGSTNDPISPISADSKRSSPRMDLEASLLQNKGNTNVNEADPLLFHTAPPKTDAAGAGAHAPLVMPVSSPSQQGDGLGLAPSRLAPDTPPQPALHQQGLASTVTTTVNVTPALLATPNEEMCGTTASCVQASPAVIHNRKSISRSSEDKAKTAENAGPSTRGTAADPSPTALPSATANASALSGAARGSKTMTSPARVSAQRGRNLAASSAPTPVQQADQSSTPPATVPAPSKNVKGHSAGSKILSPGKTKEPVAAAAPGTSKRRKIDPKTEKSRGAGQAAGANAASSEQACPPPPSGPPQSTQQNSFTASALTTPIPSTITHGPAVQEISPAKSTTRTATHSGSVTPRATATTVPPSRTSTREASTSPRFERPIAVHSAASFDPQPTASQAEDRTAESAANTSPPLSRALSRPPSRDASTLLITTATATASSPPPPEHPPPAAEEHASNAASTKTPRKSSVSTAKPTEDSEGADPRLVPTEASTAAQPTSPTARKDPLHVPSSAAASLATTPLKKTPHKASSSVAPKGNDAVHPSSASPGAQPKPEATVKQSPDTNRPTAPSKAKQEKKTASACCTVS